MATLLGFQLAGELTARLGHLPISGPICGMAALLTWLHLKGEVESELSKVCDAILANMAILFVPVGVGAMSYSGLFASAWPVIACVIVVGAGATLLTTVFVTRALIVWTARRISHLASGRSGAAACESMTVAGYAAITGDSDVTSGPL